MRRLKAWRLEAWRRRQHRLEAEALRLWREACGCGG